jgi:hypothetical protein
MCFGSGSLLGVYMMTVAVCQATRRLNFHPE